MTDASELSPEIGTETDTDLDADAGFEADVRSDAEETESPEVVPPAVFIPLEFVRVEMQLPSTHPVLVLREQDAPHRELQISIGVPEGVAIAYAAGHIATPRPLTHELFTSVIETAGVTLETIRITSVAGSAYTAELVLTGAFGIKVLECRVSDGVCLALRQRLEVPLTAAASVLDQSGFDPLEY